MAVMASLTLCGTSLQAPKAQAQSRAVNERIGSVDELDQATRGTGEQTIWAGALPLFLLAWCSG